MKAVDRHAISSNEPPMIFAENQFFIAVSSPGWFNDGHYSSQAIDLLAPLQSRLKAVFNAK
jgi:hypothetical protein